MLKNIVAGYGKVLLQFVKIFALVALCCIIGSAFVYPLWYFATTLPHTYTLVFMTIFCAVLLFLAVKKVISAGFYKTFIFLLKVLVILAGIAACIALIMSGRRFFAIPVFIATLLIYGVLSFTLKPKELVVNENQN
ncbi:MAG: hypothetical protein K6B73_03310 [Treponema sp.]|nr:hypothetical protein [Treponema sp.]